MRRRKSDASLGDTSRRRRETRLVAVRGVVLDQSALRRLVDFRKAGAEISLPGGDFGARFPQRALQTRFSCGVANSRLCGLPALFFGRADVCHRLLLLRCYLVSIPSCFRRSFASADSREFGYSWTTYWNCTIVRGLSLIARYA